MVRKCSEARLAHEGNPSDASEVEDMTPSVTHLVSKFPRHMVGLVSTNALAIQRIPVGETIFHLQKSLRKLHQIFVALETREVFVEAPLDGHFIHGHSFEVGQKVCQGGHSI